MTDLDGALELREPHARAFDSVDIALPLVLDLDDVLFSTDLLHETAVAYVLRHPFSFLSLLTIHPNWKAKLKQALAERVDPDVDLMPANEDVVRLAEAEAARGRKIILATAADSHLAKQVKERFPFIGDVLASDGSINLKGSTKADALAAFCPDGFIYAGDSLSDIPVWRMATHSVVVTRYDIVERRASALRKPLLVLRRPSHWPALLRAVRPHQWVKNSLVFVPGLLSGELFGASALVHSLMAFCAVSIGASASYVVNDVLDLAADRAHWTKRRRPFASGALPLAAAPPLALGGLGLAVFLGALVNPLCGALIALYCAGSISYSVFLKRIPFLDCLALGLLFSIRLVIGATAVGVAATAWLLVFSMFLFTSLSIAKRFTEVDRLAAKGGDIDTGRGYVPRDREFLMISGIGASIASIVIFCLYMNSLQAHEAFRDGANLLWAQPFIISIWLGRVWLLNGRGQLNDDPVAFAVKDRITLVLGGLMGAALALTIALRYLH